MKSQTSKLREELLKLEEPEDRLKVLGDGTTENIGFTGRYIDAVRNKDERALRLLNSDVEEVFANLKVAGANEEETKFKETTNMIIKDWEERNLLHHPTINRLVVAYALFHQ